MQAEVTTLWPGGSVTVRIGDGDQDQKLVTKIEPGLQPVL